MAPPSRKRAAPVEEDDDDDQSQGYEEEAAPRNTQRRRRRTQQADDSSDGEPEAATQNGGDGYTKEELIRKLVRYALACEYSRQNIRREGIREKVIGAHGRGHSFKTIFEGAQKELKLKFGMQMMELPTREKVTLKERRDAAQRNATQTSAATPNSYTLVSVLPATYRIPSIIPPSNVPTPWLEASYIGLYTTIISLISLAGGTLVEGKLDRYLKRMNAEMNMPLDSTPKVLAKMSKDGYIVKAKEVIGNEEITEWRVGPRGKVEVGAKGVKGLVEHVYGENAPDDLAKRIQSSLGLQPVKDLRDEDGAEEVQTHGNEASGSAPRRGRRRPRQEEDDDDD